MSAGGRASNNEAVHATGDTARPTPPGSGQGSYVPTPNAPAPAVLITAAHAASAALMRITIH